MKTICMLARVDLAAATGDSGRRFEILAYTGGKLFVAALPLPVVVDLSGLESPASVPILIDHEKNVESTLGIVDAIHNDGSRLVLSGDITGQSQKVHQVLAAAQAGHRWQASIGCKIEDGVEIPAGQSVRVNGQTIEGPFILAKRATLRETSVLPQGADAMTSVNLAASAETLEKAYAMSFEEWLASLGQDMAMLSEDAKAAFMLAYEAKMNSGTMGAPPAAEAAAPEAPVPEEQPAEMSAAGSVDFVARERKALATDLRRIAEIKAAAGGQHDQIVATAIEQGWTVDKTKVAILEAAVPKAPAGHVRSSVINNNVIEAALCKTGNFGSIEASFDEKTLDAADRQFRRGLGLQELVMICARQNGWQGVSFKSDPHECFRKAFEANFGTLSLPGIMSNNANKFLLEGFMGVEDSWRQIASIGSVSDFKTRTSYRLTGDHQFEKVGPGGELKTSKLGEESFTNQADTYGKMFSITERDLINDDLGALTSVPRGIGRGAALKLNDVFWTEFVSDHTTFFPTDNSEGNYQEGSGTVLSISSLTSAEQLFLDQTDPDGKPLSIDPVILLVPNALFVTATSLTRDTEIRDTTASKVYTTGNPHAGKFRPVRSSYLGNASYGNSTTGWYLLADPADLAMIEVVFLNGQQQPTVEEAEADFNKLGVQMRGTLRFGVNKQDKRAAVKSKGAA